MTRFLVGLSLILAGCGSRSGVDRIIVGKVWTGDAANPEAHAIAIVGDSIVAVGDSTTVLKLAGPNTERIEAGGGLVMPGFIDDHVHLFAGGFQLASVDLRDAATPEEFTRRIKAFAATLKPGEWITGGDWDHELWPGTPLPDRAWIDSVTPDNPVFVTRLDGHMSLANTAALAAAKVDRSIREIAGGEIVRRPDGELTGVLKDNAGNPVSAVMPAPSPSQLDSSLARAGRHAASLGVTALSSVSTSWPEVAAVKRAQQAGTLKFRVSNYLNLADWRSVAESLRVNGPGDGWIRVAGVKGLLDGSLGSTTAYFDEPFTDQPRASGMLTIPIPALNEWVTGADAAGVQVVVHAIGDRANGELLDAFQAAAVKPGFKADVVVVDRDLLTIPAAAIDQAKIRVTVVGGTVVYRTP